MNTEINRKEQVTNFLRNAAMDLSCQVLVPGYVSGQEDLITIADLMNKLATQDPVIVFPEKFKIASPSEADALFRNIASATISIYGYLVQGASLMLEYTNIEGLTTAEVEEILDEV